LRTFPVRRRFFRSFVVSFVLSLFRSFVLSFVLSFYTPVVQFLWIVAVHPYHDHINPVDGDEVPVPHFGVVLGWTEFEDLATRLKGKGVKFIIEPHVRFVGRKGEQYTMFFKDPAGNNLEFKVGLPVLSHPKCVA
jgi:extradiol dioxygenase family protein